MLIRTSTAEAVVNYFKKEIIAGSLHPGDKLPGERQLQEQFGISRFTLREGLARLSALGLIRTVHGKGTFVTDKVSTTCLNAVMLPAMTAQDDKSLRDLFDARVVIERELAYYAALRANSQQFAQLSQLLEESHKTIDNSEAFAQIDYSFHQCIAQAADNFFFLQMFEVLSEYMRDFQHKHARNHISRTNALQTHHKIVDAIIDHKPELAAQTMVGHLSGCKGSYLNALLISTNAPNMAN